MDRQLAMIRIGFSVGRGGKNKAPDVTLVQAALKVANGADYSGAIGARQNDLFFRALEQFLAKNARDEGSLMVPGGKGMAQLNAALPTRFKNLKVWRSTNIVYSDAEAAKVLAWENGQYPLPNKQAADLLRGINRWDFARKFGLDIEDVDTTPDGRFRVRLVFKRGSFLDPGTAKIVGITPAVIKYSIEALDFREWKAASRAELICETRMAWPILVRSTEALLEELALIGLQRRPSNRVLQQCGNALSAASFHQTLDAETRKTLAQCFGSGSGQIEAAIVSRAAVCKDLMHSWKVLMIRHFDRMETLVSLKQQFLKVHGKIGVLFQTIEQMDTQNWKQAFGSIPGADIAKAISDAISGRDATQVAVDLSGSRDALAGVANVAEEVGAKSVASLAKAVDLARLANDSNDVFRRTVAITKIRLGTIPELQEQRLQLLIEFYNTFAEFDAEVRSVKDLLLAFRANGCKVPPDATKLPAMWELILGAERVLTHFTFLREEALER